MRESKLFTFIAVFFSLSFDFHLVSWHSGMMVRGSVILGPNKVKWPLWDLNAGEQS